MKFDDVDMVDVLLYCLLSVQTHVGVTYHIDRCHPTKTEAICFGTSPRLQLLSNLTSIEVAGASVSLVDYVKLLGVTFDIHLNFDKHISNVCSSSYVHIRALRHIRPFLDSETSKTIACAIIGSRLDYVNSILTNISSRNIDRLQRVQNSLAWVITRWTTNTTSAFNSLHWLPILQRINLKLATHIHRSPYNAGPYTYYLYYILIRHRVSFTVPPLPTSFQHCSCLSWFSTCWPFSLEFSPSSSQIYRLLHCLQIQSKIITFSLVQASLAPNNL